jgi:hypothetical protein
LDFSLGACDAIDLKVVILPFASCVVGVGTGKVDDVRGECRGRGGERGGGGGGGGGGGSRGRDPELGVVASVPPFVFEEELGFGAVGEFVAPFIKVHPADHAVACGREGGREGGAVLVDVSPVFRSGRTRRGGRRGRGGGRVGWGGGGGGQGIGGLGFVAIVMVVVVFVVVVAGLRKFREQVPFSFFFLFQFFRLIVRVVTILVVPVRRGRRSGGWLRWQGCIFVLVLMLLLGRRWEAVVLNHDWLIRLFHFLPHRTFFLLLGLVFHQHGPASSILKGLS